MPDGWYLGEAVAIEHDSNGNKYIFNRGEHSLVKFSADGKFLQEFGHGLFKKPHGMRIDHHGNIWTTDLDTHLVIRFNPTGEITMVLGMKNKASTGWFDRDYNLILFNSPHDVAIDKNDNIYVVDKGNHRIVKLSSNGLLLRSWGSKGAKRGEFNFAHSIVIDDQNTIYIADRENQRIQLFDLNGNYLSQWNNIGYPYVLTLSDNSLWMTDARAESVSQYSFDGQLIKSFKGTPGRNHGEFGFVHGIDINNQGNIDLTQVLNWNVLSLSPVIK